MEQHKWLQRAPPYAIALAWQAVINCPGYIVGLIERQSLKEIAALFPSKTLCHVAKGSRTGFQLKKTAIRIRNFHI